MSTNIIELMKSNKMLNFLKSIDTGNLVIQRPIKINDAIDYSLDVSFYKTKIKSDYHLKPSKFCYDEYNDYDLWPIILKLNSMLKIEEFKEGIEIIYPNNLGMTNMLNYLTKI